MRGGTHVMFNIDNGGHGIYIVVVLWLATVLSNAANSPIVIYFDIINFAFCFSYIPCHNFSVGITVFDQMLVICRDFK